MSGLFTTIAWVIIVIGFLSGFLAAFISISTGAGIGLLASVGVIVGSLLTAAPFFALSEIMNRLERLQALQSRANEINADILTAIKSRSDSE